jgi:hypothetical protein
MARAGAGHFRRPFLCPVFGFGPGHRRVLRRPVVIASLLLHRLPCSQGVAAVAMKPLRFPFTAIATVNRKPPDGKKLYMLRLTQLGLDQLYKTIVWKIPMIRPNRYGKQLLVDSG